MKPFQVGDRVAVYGAEFGRDQGVIRSTINAPREISVQTPGGYLLVHPKQCRRLKPKRKARNGWVVETDNAIWAVWEGERLPSNEDGRYAITPVREVLPKKGSK